MTAVFNFGNFNTTGPLLSFDTQDNLARQYLDQNPGTPDCHHYHDGPMMTSASLTV
jgi:hypothetical protein